MSRANIRDPESILDSVVGLAWIRILKLWMRDDGKKAVYYYHSTFVESLKDLLKNCDEEVKKAGNRLLSRTVNRNARYSLYPLVQRATDVITAWCGIINLVEDQLKYCEDVFKKTYDSSCRKKM